MKGVDTRRYLVRWLALALCLATVDVQSAIPRQNTNEDQTAQSDQQDKPQDEPGQPSQTQGSQNPGSQGQESQDQPPASPSNGSRTADGSQTENSDATKNAATDDQALKPAPPAAKDTAEHKPPRNQMYGLTENYSVELSPEWRRGGSGEIPPPAILSPYAPPFHLSGNLVFSDATHGAILQFATSDNPFLGHDAYWLDTQIHSPQRFRDEFARFFLLLFFPAIRRMHP